MAPPLPPPPPRACGGRGGSWLGHGRAPAGQVVGEGAAPPRSGHSLLQGPLALHWTRRLHRLPAPQSRRLLPATPPSHVLSPLSAVRPGAAVPSPSILAAPGSVVTQTLMSA